jgi:uncharacterized membrane protein
MSDLVAICFDGKDTAEKVLTDLRQLQKEYVVDIEDACWVTRDANGKLDLHQSVNMVGGGAVSGATWGGLWGMLIGLLVLNPLAGFVVGAAAGAAGGALAGKLADYGINDDFIRQVGEAVTADTSALFVLFRKVTLERVLPDLEQYEGRILKTSLTSEQEQALRQALTQHVAQAAT